jgi:hypothetical protein
MRFLSVDELRIQLGSDHHALQQAPYHNECICFPANLLFGEASCCEFTTGTPGLLRRQLTVNA